MSNAETPNQLSALAIDFNKWAQGRTGFTIDELVDVYANLVQLSPQRTQALKDELQPKKITLNQYFQAHPELTKEEILRIKTDIVQFIAQHPEIIVTWEAPKKITLAEYYQAHPELTQEQKNSIETDLTKFSADHPEIIVPAKKPEVTKPAGPATPQKPPPAAPAKPAVPKETIIARTKFPKWWNDEGIAKIALSSPGSQFVITARSDYQLYIATIVLTVSGECVITLSFGSSGSSGPMRFGGSDEPRGIVIAMGNSPAPCGSGSFMITAASGSAVDIGGFVSYFLWKKEPT